MLPSLCRSPSSSLLLRRAFSTTPRSNLARITVVGRLAADPEVTTLPTGTEVIKYAVGTSDGPVANQKTSWYRFSAFADGPKKDYLLGLKRGTLVYVEGNAKLDNYQAEDGKTHQTLRLTQSSIRALLRPQQQSEAATDESL